MTARLDLTRQALASLTETLSTAERARAQRFRFDRDRCRFVVARASLRQLLGERLGARPEAIEFVYGSKGKPALARHFAGSRWRFNLARREGVAVYGFSRAGEVGIDLEAVRPLPESDAIAATFFSTRENEAYRAVAPRYRPLAFLYCWTRKEALAKALGAGLSAPVHELEVSTAAASGWEIGSFAPLPGFIAAAALGRDD